MLIIAIKNFFNITPAEAVYVLTNKFNCKVTFVDENNMEELLTSGSSIYIKEGALKLENDKVLADITWLITTNANISSIVLDK